MKYLRYIIFIVFICFFSMFNVKALDGYFDSHDESTKAGPISDFQLYFYIQGHDPHIYIYINDGTGGQTLTLENNGDFTINTAHYKIDIPSEDVQKIFDNNNNFQYTFTNNYELPYNRYHYTLKVLGDNKFITCTYQMNTLYDHDNLLTCDITNNGVRCTPNSTFHVETIENNSLKPDDFFKNGEYNCSNLSKFYADYTFKTDTSYTDDQIVYTIHDIKTSNNCENTCATFNFYNETLYDPEEVEPEKTEFNAETFCSKAVVKGAFRTLGWVIFFIKIIVPIIIIVLGSIDVFKAVTSNKSDELNKSIKTLVMRVIAGIIIFLIPTFINFIIKFVSGGEEIYSDQDGTFKNCTYCMLNPTDDKCGSLMGGE